MTDEKFRLRALCYEFIYPIENTKFFIMISGKLNSF